MNFYVDAFKKFADFRGTATRKEYWMFVLINFIISVIISMIVRVTDINLLSTLYSLIILIPSISIMVRRLHDAGKSGFWILIIFTIIGIIPLLVFLCMEQKTDNNPYAVKATIQDI